MDMIKLDQIKLKSPYLRTNTDIESLIKSIKTIGLIHPLTVNANNELLAGARRYQALKELGFTEVPVVMSDRGELEQELISVDENLVRKPLSKLEVEQCLNRGREIYEKLNPTANKVDIEKEAHTPAEKKQEREIEEADETSYAAVTAEKLGVSKSVIKKAIRRDAKSSEEVKAARSAGEVSASQVNEMIKLSSSEQDTILPYIKDKSVKEVRKLVDTVKSHGIKEAINKSLNEKELPKEFSQLNSQLKKCHRMTSKVLIEDFDTDHPKMNEVLKSARQLQDHLTQFLDLYEISERNSGDYGSEEILQ